MTVGTFDSFEHDDIETWDAVIGEPTFPDLDEIEDEPDEVSDSE